MSSGMSKAPGKPVQALVDQVPVFDSGHKHKTVMSKAGIQRPTKKKPKTRFL